MELQSNVSALLAGVELEDEAIPIEDVGPGAYFTEDGRVARVKPSRSTGRLYAEVLDPEDGVWDYQRGAIFHLTRRMTLDEAEAFSARMGACCMCGRLLSAQDSVERGIGPICRRYWTCRN